MCIKKDTHSVFYSFIVYPKQRNIVESHTVSFKLCIKLLVLNGSSDRANIGTSTALCASVSVDLILAVSLGDSAYRALTCTSAAGDAVVCNLISHYCYLLAC